MLCWTFQPAKTINMPDPNKINCLIVDDEPPAIEVLRNYVSLLPSLHLVGCCTNAFLAIEALRVNKVDLIFLDIQMPQLLGTEFLRSLKHPPKVIFTTAFRKFALEGFELDAVDYLLKPISFERFLKGVNKVMGKNIGASGRQPETSVSPDAFICFRADRKSVKVFLHEILFIESLKDYIKVVTPTKTIVTKQSISSVEEALPKSEFVRIHRSYIVSLKRVRCFTSELIEIDKYELPVSRMYKHEVEQALGGGV